MTGFALSFGAFQNWYNINEPFHGNKNIPLVGTFATAIMFLGSPLAGPITKRYRQYRTHMIFIGWLLCITSLVMASLATNMGALILTQGVMYGIGELILYYPIIDLINEWFIKKRGLAYGIMCCSAGLSGMVIPFIVEILLNRYGYQTTLRAFAIALGILTGPTIPFLRGRSRSKSYYNEVPKTDWSFVKKPFLYVFATSNIFQGLAFYMPLLFLPSYATSLGLSAEAGALLLALVSLAQVIGQVTFGFLSDDRLHLHFLIFISPFVSSVAAFSLWGFASSLTPLIFFSIIYGFFAASYVVLWAKMGLILTNDPTASLVTYSIFAFEKGVGNVLVGPISNLLNVPTITKGSYGAEKYRGIVLFTGVCMLISSLVVVVWHLCTMRLRIRRK